jgi:hypothetical protein
MSPVINFFLQVLIYCVSYSGDYCTVVLRIVLLFFMLFKYSGLNVVEIHINIAVLSIM